MCLTNINLIKCFSIMYGHRLLKALDPVRSPLISLRSVNFCLSFCYFARLGETANHLVSESGFDMYIRNDMTSRIHPATGHPL